MFTQHFALGFQPGVSRHSLGVEPNCVSRAGFSNEDCPVAALRTCLYLWIVKSCFTERKRRLSRHVGHKRHGSPMNSNSLVWRVTLSPGHSVPCWSLLTMVQGGTSSALKQRTVPSLVTKGSPESATQRLSLNYRQWPQGPRNALRRGIKRENMALKLFCFFLPHWTPLLQRDLTGFFLLLIK